MPRSPMNALKPHDQVVAKAARTKVAKQIERLTATPNGSVYLHGFFLS
jgi:hypothetical protein